MRRRRRRPSRILRIFMRMVAAAGLLACALALFVYFVPFSWPALTRNAQQRLSELAGANAIIERARVSLSQGRCEVHNVAFFDTDTPDEPLLTLRRIDLKFHVSSLLAGRGRMFESVEISDPSQIRVSYDANGLYPDSRAEFLRRVVTRRPKTGGGLPFHRLRLSNASIAFSEVPTTASATAGGFRLDRASITLAQLQPGMIRTDIEGTLFCDGTESPLIGQVTAGQDQSADVVVSAPKLHLAGIVPGEPGASATAQDLALRLSIGRDSGSWRIEGEAAAGTLSARLPSRNIDVTDSDAKATWRMFLDPQSATVSIDSLAVESRQLSAQVSGSYTLADPFAFDATVRSRRLGQTYAGFFATLLPPGYELHADRESFALDTAARGDRHGLASLVGRFDFTSVTLACDQFRKPLSDLRGEIDFEPGRVVLHDLAGRIDRTQLHIEGAIEGDYLRNRSGKLSLRWEAGGPADDLIVLVGGKPRPGPGGAHGKGAGSIQSSGTVEQVFALRDPSAGTVPAISGAIVLRDVAFSHRALPAPVQGLSGNLTVRGNSVRIEAMRGDVQGNEIRIDGECTGQRTFWRDPKLAATVAMKLDLPRIVALLPPEQRGVADRYSLHGHADASIRIKTELWHPERSDFTGRATIRDVAFSPNLAFMSGMFADVDGVVAWDGSTLELEDFSGTINGERIRASGTLSPRAINLSIRSRMDLQWLEATFPRIRPWMSMSGPAQLEARLSIDDSTAAGAGAVPVMEPRFGGTLIPLMTLVQQRIEEAVAQKNYRLNGSIGLMGARIRHHSMPGRRDDPKLGAVPAGDMNDIHGTLLLAGNVLRVPESSPLRLRMANSGPATLSGEIEHRIGGWPRMNFRLAVEGEAKLDSWIRGWGQGLPRLPQPPPPADKVFEMTGRITARSTIYKGYTAGPLRLQVAFTARPGQPKQTRFQDIVLEGLQGRLSASGELETFPWDDGTRFPKWDVRVDVRNMQLSPLLSCVFGDIRNLDAIATTQMRLQCTGRGNERIRGSGTGALRNLVIGRTHVGRYIGQSTGQSLEGRLFETARAADFRIANGALSTSKLELQSQGMMMEMHGSYLFTKEIDAMVRIGLLESLLGTVPIVGPLANLVDRAAGQLLFAVQVKGPVSNPSITPVALPMFQGVGAP